MGREYCQHMVRIDEECDECNARCSECGVSSADCTLEFGMCPNCAATPYVPWDAWDAARAWQAFRDFLNGTPKEWARHALDQYLRGVKEGLNGGQA